MNHRVAPAITAFLLSFPALASASPQPSAADEPAATAENDDAAATGASDSRGVEVAYAGPPGAFEPEPAPAPVPAATDGEAGLAGFRDRDAASGRAWGSPTALTAPRGKVQLGYWGVPSEVGFATVGYGVTDRLQIAAGVGWDHSVSYDCFDCTYQQRTTAATLSAKYQVARRAHTAVALQASWLTVDDTALSTWSLVATHCLDGDACKVVGSAHLSFLIEADAYDSYGNVATAVHGVVGGSLIAGNRLKAVLDVGVVGADENDRFTLAYGGVRWAGRRLAGDLGFLTAIQDGDTETAPVPLLSVSGRL